MLGGLELFEGIWGMSGIFGGISGAFGGFRGV